MPRTLRFLVAGLLLAAVVVPPATAGEAGVVQVFSLSNRADLVSGGQVLLEVTIPEGASFDQLTVERDGIDVTQAFAVRSDGRFKGLVDGLELGENQVTATLDDGPLAGNGATLTVTNHPIGGPVFSGPQVQPWACDEGALDEQCNREVTYEWMYMPSDGGGLAAYDPEAPADDVATTTTDQGNEVPFIVRVEHGVIARDNYTIAVLYNPEEPWDPTEPQPGYNGKVVSYHGANCSKDYNQASAPDVLAADILALGFATYSHALNNSGHNCHPVTQAEAMVMTKEHLAETYGEIRYMIGQGCSGGALAQYWMANAYPGLYQGITVACSFMDAWSSANQYVDYDLLRAYFESDEGISGGWTPAQWSAVYGHPNAANAVTFTEVIPNGGDPKGPCNGVPEGESYDPETNPDGVKCSLQDWMVNVFGLREEGDGHANRPYSNTGVQYGLQALLDGTILPEQFIALNVGIGSFDHDYNLVPERTQSDEEAAERVYTSGGNNTAENLDEVAIIDYRGPDPGAFHDTYRTYAIRERIIRQHGDADNMLIWRGSVPLFGDTTFDFETIIAMDKWLAAVEADTREDVDLATKIAEDRPEDVVDRCASGNGTEMPAEYCDAIVDVYETPRIVAGAPTTDDVMRCELIPIEEFDYSPVALSEANLEALRVAFPDGVCDYTKPDPYFAETIPWLDYTDGPGGVPLGEAPVSVPFGPGERVIQRHAGPDRVATAVAVSGDGYEQAETVVLASAGNLAPTGPSYVGPSSPPGLTSAPLAGGFADALAGAPLAAVLDAPLLLTASESLSAATAEEIERLGATSAIVLGGTAALSEGVDAGLQALGVTVERVAGDDRFATAVAVADRMGVGAGEVFLASAEEFADALSVSALAAMAGRPLLLTSGDSLPAATADALAGVEEVTIAGGTAAVSQEVADEVTALGATVERLEGSTRYATSVAVAEEALARGATLEHVWVATGRDFPDGLVAGAAAAHDDGVLLLVDGQDAAGAPESLAFLSDHAGDVGSVHVAGGVAAVTNAVAAAVETAIAVTEA